LFVEGHAGADEAGSPHDSVVAGRLDDEFVDVRRVVNPAPEAITVSLTLERSESVAKVLGDAGLEPAEAQRWAMLFQGAIATRLFSRGHYLSLYKDPDTGDLRGFRYNIDDRIAVTEDTYGNGVIRTFREPIRYVVQPVAISFRLKNDFWHEAQRNGLPKPITATLEYAFKDRHPLGQLPRGANIRLIYQERVSRDGSARLVTGLEAAQIHFGDETLSAFAFRDGNGQAHLYDANGDALGPQALRFPLNFLYISSGFTFHRYHPLLHAYRPHVGVDLVAHYGTPVAAVADGRVESAGWSGELGRCIRIRHDGAVVSIYGHLSEISPGIEEGATVREGEIIGRVGSTGLSTGAHLHYGIEKHGRYVNPLTETLGVHRHVSPAMRQLFERFKQNYLAVLDRMPDLGGHLLAPHGASLVLNHDSSGVGVLDTGFRDAATAVRTAIPAQVSVDKSARVISGRASVIR
jgi:murein DD-endopeptidase MepM/ murein hydrolase activator NlpD